MAPVDLTAVRRDNPDTAALVDTFVEACLDGALHGARNRVVEIKANSAPYWVRQDREPGLSIRYYKLKGPTNAYLVLESYNPVGEDGVITKCVVASNRLDLKAAGMLVHQAITGVVPKYVDDSHGYASFLPNQDFYVQVTAYHLLGTRYDAATSARLAGKLRKRPGPIVPSEQGQINK